MGSEALFAKFADRCRDFLDIGAHVGYYSVYLSPLIRKAFAFEPDPRNVPDLEINAQLARNVEIVQAAVSSCRGTGRLHVGRCSAVSSLQPGGYESMEVSLTTLDDFVLSRSDVEVALIKTDIEGHDLEALEGASETIKRWQPLILTECNRLELWALCKDWDYIIFAFTTDRRSLKKDFCRMIAGDLTDRWYKMLFLVPRHLQTTFENLRNG